MKEGEVYMNCSTEFERHMKTSKGKLIVALVLIAMCLINEASSYMVMQNIKEKPIEFGDATKAGQYTCIEVDYISDGFADYSDSNSTSMSAYYVSNEDELYVVGMNEETFKKFDKIVEYWTSDDEDMEEPEPVRLCGNTDTIPANLRDLAVKYYNQGATDNKITSTDFSNYFKYFLNTQAGPEEDFVIQSVVAGIFGFIGLLFLILYLRDANRTKKTLAKYANEMEKIKMEIASPETIYEKKAKIFLTKERLINVANGMEIYDYKDIIWVYPYEMRQNGYTTQRSIYVVTKDTKAHLIANISASKKNNLMFEELYESLLIRLPDAMHGYTKENKDAVKEMSKKK